MATTYTLKFEKFRVQDNYNDGVNPVMTDVVRELYWRLEGVTDDPTPLKAAIYGSNVLDLPTYGSFIERTSLVVGDVHGWFASLTNADGDNLLDALKASIDAKIAEQAAPVEHQDAPDSSFTDGVPV